MTITMIHFNDIDDSGDRDDDYDDNDNDNEYGANDDDNHSHVLLLFLSKI